MTEYEIQRIKIEKQKFSEMKRANELKKIEVKAQLTAHYNSNLITLDACATNLEAIRKI